MLGQAARESILFRLWKPANIGFLTAWLFAAVVLLCKLRHITLLFPFLVFLWLLAFIVWFGVAKWEWGTILVAPALAALACLPLTFAYWGYTSRESERALNEFIHYVVEGESSLEFSLMNRTRPPAPPSLSTLANDFTADYTIAARDTFGVEYEWAVRFVNNSVYYIAMVQVSPGHWEVYARKENEPVP